MESILTKTGVTTLWNKIKSTFFPLSGGTITGVTRITANTFVTGTLVKFLSANPNKAAFSVSDTASVIAVPASMDTITTTGNVGISTAVNTSYNLNVKTNAQIPTLYTNRIYPIDEDDFIIGSDDNSGYIKISTDMKGWDLNGYDEGTMDEPDSNWSINTVGNARFITVSAPTISATDTATVKDLVITNSLKAKSGSTTYKLNFAKAIQLGLFTTA